MVNVGLIVPVYRNLQGALELLRSVDMPIRPYIIPNYTDNIGVSKGWNAGLRMAIRDSVDVAFVLNDDAVFLPGTMQKIVDATDRFDMVTGRNNRDDKKDYVEEYVESPDFSCFAVKPADFISKFGWFDENFTPAYFEDNDMHYRMKLAGGVAVTRLDAPFFHEGSVTQNWGGQQVVTGAMFERNRDYYIWKWGGGPGQETRKSPNGVEQDIEIGVGIE